MECLERTSWGKYMLLSVDRKDLKANVVKGNLLHVPFPSKIYFSVYFK